MTINCFLYGLTAFIMAMVVLLRGRRTSRLALGQHFIWLSAFGLLMSVYAWSSMFEAIADTVLIANWASVVMMFALPIAGVMLVRFGIGLIADAGHLPDWLALLPIMLFVPVSLLVAYGMVIVLTSPLEGALLQWSRYLLIFPGSLLAAVGCVQQWRRLKASDTIGILRETLLLAGGAFLFNGVISGLVTTGEGWLSATTVETVTGIPVHMWRILSIVLLTIAVIGMMRLFEFEREQELEILENQHQQAQENALRIRLKSRREAETWLDGIVRISRRIANIEPEDTVLCAVVETARKAVDSDVAALALRDVHQTPTLRYQSTATRTTPLVSIPLHNFHILRVMETGEALRYPQDTQLCPFVWEDDNQSWQVEQAAVVPLVLNGMVIGVMWTGRGQGAPFTCGDLVGLGHLADQIVIALEHATMAARLQSLAMVEERSRIAREMHDGLAQILGYLGLEMQTLEALVRQGNTDAVLSELATARHEIKSAHADVRQNILSLRTTLSQDIDLKQGLQTYVQEFGVQTGIQASFLDNTCDDLTLSPLAEAHLTRIIQEALANIRKHARASEVHVKLTTDKGWLQLNVVDNGKGFQPEVASNSHFGLQTMRERAEDVGGNLIIDSTLAEGTTVRLSLPLL